MSAFGGLFKFVLGGAAGTAIGLAVGSLLAPQKGTEFQEGVQQRLSESKAAGDDAEREVVAELQDRYRRKVGDATAFTGVRQAGGTN